MNTYIFIFFSVTIGLFAGIWCGLMFLKEWNKPSEKTEQRKKQRISKIKNRAQEKYDKSIDKEKLKEDEEGKNILKEKLIKPNVSMMEFSNAADGENHEEYVKKCRSKEDCAYNILKQKMSE